MAGSEPVTVARIETLAQTLGLDLAKLKADMESPELHQVLSRNRELATALQVQGTPAFIVGTELVPAAMNAEQFQARIDRFRKERKLASISSPQKSTSKPVAKR